MAGTASLPKDPFCQGPCSVLVLCSTSQQLFPTLLPPPALFFAAGFTSQADAISGIFALTLLARDRQGLGSRSGCSSLTMVMNPDSVCSSSLVLHRDSGWDCGTKARETQILGLSTAKRAQAHPADPLDLPRGVGLPVATSHGPARARGTLNTTKNQSLPKVGVTPATPTTTVPQSPAGLRGAGDHSSTASSCAPLTPLALGFPGRWLADIPYQSQGYTH